MSSFAINGRIVADSPNGSYAVVRALPDEGLPGASQEILTHRVEGAEDARMRVFELVATLAREIRGRGDHVSIVEIE